MKGIGKFKHVAQQIQSKLKGLFTPEGLNTTARKTRFIQRSSSKIQAMDFIQLMTSELLVEPDVSTEGLCDRLEELNPEARVTAQALNARINTEEAVAYVKTVFEQSLQANLSPLVNQLPAPLLSSFGRVLLEDSTSVELHEKLADEFKGSGGSASKSALKIDYVFDVKNESAIHIEVGKGTVTDQSRASMIVDHLQEGDLVVRDLGYFVQLALGRIDEKKAFYLSRLLKSVHVYLEPEGEAVDLIDYVNQPGTRHLEVIELSAHIGSERVPVRLIGYRLPDAVVNERRRKARQAAQKKNRKPPSREYLNWLAFSFYITNVDAELWPAAVIGTVYRLRWQIELIFKQWKSLLQIHVLRGQRRERIECLVYGRLLAILMIQPIAACASWMARELYQRELSVHKLINWIKRGGRLVQAIYEQQLDAVLEALMEALPRGLCKQQRKRLTSRQMIEQQVPYMESFPNENTSVAT
ncbi:MAG: IS4 family transposase [Gammaproteobacteria bacterium]|nr:IS4 family transposase [Gammaproteobacteria bacterium]